MEISSTMVKELRVKTGAGMMDCKEALIAAEGDFEKAIDFLRKSLLGTKSASKIATNSALVKFSPYCNAPAL